MAPSRELIDPPLSALGRTQAQLVGEALSTEKIDAVYASPLQRARDTGAQIARHHRLDPVVVEDLQEVAVFRDIPRDRTPLDYIGVQVLRGVRERMVVEKSWDVYPLLGGQLRVPQACDQRDRGHHAQPPRRSASSSPATAASSTPTSATSSARSTTCSSARPTPPSTSSPAPTAVARSSASTMCTTWRRQRAASTASDAVVRCGLLEQRGAHDQTAIRRHPAVSRDRGDAPQRTARYRRADRVPQPRVAADPRPDRLAERGRARQVRLRALLRAHDVSRHRALSRGPLPRHRREDGRAPERVHKRRLHELPPHLRRRGPGADARARGGPIHAPELLGG